MSKRYLGVAVLIAAGVTAGTAGAAVVGGAGWGLLLFGTFAFVLGVLLGME